MPCSKIDETEKLSIEELKLSEQQGTTLFQSLFVICDEAFSYGERLKKAGFLACDPRVKFMESFCDDQCELALYRQCVIEWGKEILALNMNVKKSGGNDKRRIRFRSPFLQELRKKRDRDNGVPENELESIYPNSEVTWRSQVDPAERNRWRSRALNAEAYEKRWSEMLLAQRQQLKQESLFSSGLADACPYTYDGRYEFYITLMDKEVIKYGFSFDKAKSKRKYPIYSKSIIGDWELCWAIEERQPFCMDFYEGCLLPYLEVRHRTDRVVYADHKASDVMRIGYSAIIPGFFTGYRKFSDFRQMEIIIKAHLYLYGMMEHTIVNSLLQALKAD